MTTPGGSVLADDLLAAGSVDERRAQLSKAGMLNPGGLGDLLSLATEMAHTDSDAALILLDLCETTAGDAGAPETRPAARYVRARVTLNSGDPATALELIGHCREGWLELDRPLDAHRTQLGRMAVLDDLGRHEEAAKVAQDLLAELDLVAVGTDEVEQLRWMQAAALENLGVASGFTGQHERALEAYRDAERAYAEIGLEPEVARARANRGVELVAVGRATEGLDLLVTAAKTFETGGDQLSFAKCLGHQGDAEMLLGRYSSGLTTYERAQQMLDELGARTEANRLRLGTASAYLALGLTDEAAVVAEEAGQRFAEAGINHDLATAQWTVAVSRLRAGHADKGLEPINEAICGLEAVGDQPMKAQALLTKSEILHHLGRHEEAMESAMESSGLLELGAWPVGRVVAQLWLAELSEPDLEQCETHLLAAAELAAEVALPHLLHPVAYRLGRLRRRQGRRAEAIAQLESAIAVVEGLRAAIHHEAVRTSFLHGRTAAHTELIALLLDSGSADDRQRAFELAEQSKARTLLDVMAGTTRVDSPAVVGDDPVSIRLAKDVDDLNAAYGELLRVEAHHSPARRRLVRRRADELEQAVKLGRLRSQARDTTTDDNSRSSELAHPNLGRPNVEGSVVAYHVLDEEIMAFVSIGGQISAHRHLSTVAELEGLLGQLDQQFTRYRLAGRDLVGPQADVLLETTRQVLRQLYVALLGPLEDHLSLSQDLSEDDLLLVTHGPLHRVPFQALYDGERHMLDRWTLTVAPSIAVADFAGRRNRQHKTQSLVLGLPDSAIPSVAAEARDVAAVLPDADLLTGSEASFEALRSRGVDCDIIHLACHGIFRDENPMFSAVQLHDRWMTSMDVMSLNLEGALVVLSSCESGRQSAPGAGDEAVGLARAFLAAGARAVVVSLWLVDDDSAAELMGRFYRFLVSGHSVSSALRQAQRALVADKPHPYHWAPFIVVSGLSPTRNT